ncbi:ATP-dependent RNA helicase DDX1-like [Nematostella vectensis]|uniref:ATP-dependent RNA helicase DDX1-like n=1 Tax=Nematostella vectensis TaxID=45351 RepID=UPI0020770026|nr:ATP-dependent RNA helicase DDX1-like [Nematostella vectensis]
MAGHFSEFGMLPEICKAVEDMDWLLPTDVQAEAIPLILGGGDVLMAAETGSGKTGAFCLPVIQIVHETIRDALSGKVSKASSVSGPSTFKMNPFDRGDTFTIDEEGYLCQSRDFYKWQGCRSTLGVKKGKYYYEATVTDEGLCRVGWSTAHATLDLGTDEEGFGFGGTGKKSYNRQFDTYGEPFGINDTIGCYINLDNGTVKYSKNGVDFGKAFDIPQALLGKTFFAAVVLKNAEMKFNFGDSSFQCPPKGDYIPLSKAPKDVTAAGGDTASIQSKPGKFSNRCAPSAIIIEPSRELAHQTHAQIHLFQKHLPQPKVKPVLLVGGENAKDQIRQLNDGVDIVTGTPGKLNDFITTDKISLHQVKFFILDEADGLLAQGNNDLIMKIYNKIPKITAGKRLQIVTCSATLHSFDVKKLAERIMHFPTWVDLKGQDSVPETVHHVVCHVDPLVDTSWVNLKKKVKTDGVHAKDNIKPNSQSPESLSEAVKILKAEYLVKAIDEHKMDSGIIFCRTKLDCDNIEQYLLSLGEGPKAMVNAYSSVCLHGDRSPQERKTNLQKFKDNEVCFLICTDVAARGIDIQGVPYVINVTFPDDKQNYVHRIGRVGRADRMGLALSLVSDVKEKVWYHTCPNRGKGCFNTRLKDQGGCSIWYNETQYLADVEDHLGETIPVIQPDMKVASNEFDGKVVYGAKRGKGAVFQTHTAELAPSVQELAALEQQAQTSFIDLMHRNWTKVR